LIVSHFPLHIPRAEQSRLLTETRDALAENGQIYLVSLAAYDLRPMLRAVSGGASTVAERTVDRGVGYRVVAAARADALKTQG
jgi:hypothetical protein